MLSTVVMVLTLATWDAGGMRDKVQLYKAASLAACYDAVDFVAGEHLSRGEMARAVRCEVRTEPVTDCIEIDAAFAGRSR